MGEYEEFSFIDLILRIKKRIVLVLAIIIVATVIPLVAGIVTYKPIYEAKTGIIVEMPGQDEDSKVADNTLYASLMATYVQIAKTNNIAKMAATEIYGITPDELLSNLDVTAQETSMFMYISIKNEDPDIAYKAVNSYTKAFITRAAELLPEGKLTIFDDSQKPTGPINSNVTTINIAIGFVIGIMVSVTLAFILEEIEIRKMNKAIKNIKN